MKMSLKEDLKKEIDKWLPKARKEFGKIKSAKDHSFLENIEAYLQDAGYFLEKEDLIRAFEAVVWAWAWLEIGKREGILK
jgi:hypothetical protein